MAERLLFPFANYFKQMELGQYWWHRLAKASYIVILISTVVPVSISKISADREARDSNQMLLLTMAARETVQDVPASQKRQAVEEYFKTKDEIAAEFPKNVSEDILFAIAMGVLCSYALQGLYRLGLYVRFGEHSTQ